MLIYSQTEIACNNRPPSHFSFALFQLNFTGVLRNAELTQEVMLELERALSLWNMLADKKSLLLIKRNLALSFY